jgi:glycosyltransferase involved in cell wall biosynthesis
MPETTDRPTEPGPVEQAFVPIAPPSATSNTYRLPDDPPPIWGNVPPRNPSFTGRDELLEQLGRRLTAGGTTAVLLSALHGLGVIGKTQMATEYVYRHRQDYELVWWIDATDTTQIQVGLAELARELRLDDATDETATAVRAVREALRTGRPYRRWLLVFDAAKSPEAVLPFFPRNGPGNILVTSRNSNWANIVPPLELEPLPTPQISADRRLQVLAVNTEWSSRHGGLSTFNRQLCISLAARGVDVFCSVPNASEAEHRDAAAVGVHLVHPPAALDPSENVLGRPPRTSRELCPDVVIGHGRISGRAASWLVEDYYRDAKLIDFLHVIPDRLEFEKDHGADGDAMGAADERVRAELAIASQADLAVAVGPVVHHYLVDLLYGADGPRTHRFDPGFDLGIGPVGPPPRSDTQRVLLLGRLNLRQAKVKGIDVAARALGKVTSQRGADEPTVELVLRGVEKGEGPALREAVRAWAGTSSLRVTPRPYAADDVTLRQDLRQASVVLMPSRAEGFGLVGVESIAMGVPTLISKSSGLGALLSEERNNLSIELVNRVIPVTDNDEIDALRWSDAILAVLNNPKPAFTAARALRSDMMRLRTCEMAATALLDTIGSLLRMPT